MTHSFPTRRSPDLSPEALGEALGDLGEGRLALVSSAAGDADFAATSLAAKVQGPLAIRQLLARLHVAETLDQARALQARLGEGESVITRHGERLGAGWVRVLDRQSTRLNSSH